MVHNDYTRTNGDDVRIETHGIAPTRFLLTRPVNGVIDKRLIVKGKTTKLALAKALETGELWAWGDGQRRTES